MILLWIYCSILVKKGKEDKPWFDGREYHCLRKVNKESCQPIRNGTTCFGSILPYSMTSMDLTDLYTQEESHDRLVVYQEIFKYVPKCWPVIQPFLCAVFLPQCERGYVYLPSFEMCKLAMDHCSTMYDKNFLPNYLKCDEKLFPKECKNELRKVKFNGTGQCMAPLVASESSSYRGKLIHFNNLSVLTQLNIDRNRRMWTRMQGSSLH